VQDHARAKWLAARSAELLPVPYLHVVFTLPHELSGLALQNKRLLYDLLFRTSAATLLEVARDPKHLGADLGLLSVLHTWGQNLQHHPHVHCVVPAGGLALDGSRWIPASPRFFLPVRVLSRVFRGKFTAGLKQLLLQGKLQFHGSLEELATPERFRHLLRQLFAKEWVVYAKPPFGGAEHVLHYLARYTHRVAISNHRLVAFKENRVSFRWKDYACSGKQKIMTYVPMNFCGASSSTSCPEAWFASATSVSLPTADEPHRSCVAARFSAPWRHRNSLHQAVYFGARCALETCSSSSGSQVHSFTSVQASCCPTQREKASTAPNLLMIYSALINVHSRDALARNAVVRSFDMNDLQKHHFSRPASTALYSTSPNVRFSMLAFTVATPPRDGLAHIESP
jgi:hypothetical protein